MEVGRVYMVDFSYDADQVIQAGIVPTDENGDPVFKVLLLPGQSEVTLRYDHGLWDFRSEPEGLLPQDLEDQIVDWIGTLEFRYFGKVDKDQLDKIDFTLPADPPRTTQMLLAHRACKKPGDVINICGIKSIFKEQ